MLSENQEYPLSYFRPGQLAFFVMHPGQGEPTEQQVDALINKSTSVLKDLRYEAKLEKGPRFSFSAVPDKCHDSKLVDQRKPKITPRGASSLIFADVTGVGNDQIQLFKLIASLEAQLLEAPQIDGLALEAVSPNWLVSGAPGQGSTGGPGSWPVAYRGAPDRAPYRFNNLPDIVKTSRQGKDVDVLILDTVWHKEDLDAAYDEWQDRHPLIHSLLRRNGPLHLLPAQESDRKRIADMRVRGHEYEMPDHGLFAAGIVHTIAPCAEIYLIEVLNPYGVGDFLSIFNGLTQAIQLIKQNRGKRFVVVNCSLVLNLPNDDEHCCTVPNRDGDCFVVHSEQDRELEEEICRQKQEDRLWLERQRLTLQHACDLIYTENSRVIAAAGNDWRPERERSRPQARYPAALDSVQGVGALPRVPVLISGRFKTSSYSNVADRPEKIGIATLGGEEGEGKGVLGLYLGKFPGCEANCTKWAWWAGTSFATPILSGVTAAILSGLPRPRATQEAIDELYIRGIIKEEERGTVDKEDVLEMTQG